MLNMQEGYAAIINLHTTSGCHIGKNRVSDNVGGVKQNWSVPSRALKKERHFALVEIVPFQPRLAS